MPDDHRLTLLEHAQWLHDATLRRHGEMLDRHALEIQTLRDQTLRDLAVRQQTLLETLTDVVVRVQTTLDAIKDLLDRGNGH